MANGESIGVKLPEPVISALKNTGFWGVLILILLGAVLGFYETPMSSKLDAHIKETDRHQRIQMQMGWYNQRVLEQICIRLSTTADERNRCLPIQQLTPSTDDTRSNR